MSATIHMPGDLERLNNELTALTRKAMLATVKIRVINFATNQAWLGGGAIVSENGHIITCWHLIEDVPDPEIYVFYPVPNNGRNKNSSLNRTDSFDIKVIKAELVGYAPENDLALLKINEDTPNYFTFGESVHRGNLVIAIGHPFNEYNVSLGIISGKNIKTDGQYFDLSDALINPGNSGGPVVNAGGELVGIYSAIVPGIDPDYYGQRIGLLTSARDIKELLPRLRESGGIPVVKSYLGAHLAGFDENWESRQNEEISIEDIHKLRFDELLVVDIDPGSPAEKAGIQKYDRVLKINNLLITTELEFWHEVLYKKPGKEITFKILRASKIITRRAYLSSARQPPKAK